MCENDYRNGMLNTKAINLIMKRMTIMQECLYCGLKCSYHENDYTNGIFNTVAKSVVIIRMTTKTEC